MKRVLKKRIVYIPAIIIIIVLIAIPYFSSKKNGDLNLAQAAKRDIVQTVSVTGKVKSVSDVTLAFERGGRVKSLPVDVGTKVSIGQTLASLENSDLLADVAQAEAKVKAEQAKLDQLNKGSTQEDIDVAQSQYNSAQSALADAKRLAVDAIRDAYTKADDVLYNKADQFFSNPRSSAPIFTLAADFQVKISVQNLRLDIGKMFTDWSTKVQTASATGDISAQLDLAQKNLASLRDFLDLLASAVNNASANNSISQTTLDTYKASVLTARTTVTSAISDLSLSLKSVRAAESDLALQNSKLILAKTPARPETIRQQEAALEQARASLLGSQAQLNKSILRSPIEGVVTKRDAELGEIISANTPVVTVISTNSYKMEANIPESDIATVKVGDTADVTLDAYTGVHFQAVVASLDPAETVVEGVPTYRAVFMFVNQDDRIRSGMTANIDIAVSKVSGAITVPSRSVKDVNGKKIIQIKEGDALKDIEVSLGIKDSEGNIEIKQGISEGQTVVIPTVR